MFHGDASPFLEAGQPDGGPASSSGNRLFPTLENARIRLLAGPDGQPSADLTKKALEGIAERMVGPNDLEDQPGALGETPAAFTYFGQFVFHDMVFSRVFGLARNDGPHVRNAVSFGLDLSGLYGRGPSVDGYLYVMPAGGALDTCQFPLGLPRARNSMEPVDGKAEKGRDLPRIDTCGRFISAGGRTMPYRPLVADARNDDNLILSQLLVTLMRTHNRLVDVQLAGGVDPKRVFWRAKRFLTNAYRRVVIHDYMERILHKDIWALFFSKEGDFRGPFVQWLEQRSLTGLPVEFTFAASRFAHAMVRKSYHVNEEFDDAAGTLEELLTFSSRRDHGDVPIPVNWMVDWRRFVGDGPRVQRARRISPFLSPALTMAPLELTRERAIPRSVAFMDCWRCYDIGLPSGQAVARALPGILAEVPLDTTIDVEVIEGDAMLPTEACMKRYPISSGKLAGALKGMPSFLSDTPLSYYILQEASRQNDDGNKLGIVGSYIVGATVAASLFLASDSEVRTGNVRADGLRTLADLLDLHDPDRTTDDELLQLLA